jgi:hypothetical protein
LTDMAESPRTGVDGVDGITLPYCEVIGIAGEGEGNYIRTFGRNGEDKEHDAGEEFGWEVLDEGVRWCC